MLSLLNKGHYVSPGKLEVAQKTASSEQKRQYDNLVQSGRYVNRYHFGCLFKDTTFSYPYANTKMPKPNTGASIIHKGKQDPYKAPHVLEGTKAPFVSLKSRNQSQDKMSQTDDEEQIEFAYDDAYSEQEEQSRPDEQVETLPKAGRFESDNYNQPMVVYCFPGSPVDFPKICKMFNETAQKPTPSREQDLQSTQKKRTSKRLVSTSSSPTKEDKSNFRNPINPFTPTTTTTMTETRRPEPRKSLFEEIDAINTLNNAARRIQGAFRRFLEWKKAEKERAYQRSLVFHSNFTSFGEDHIRPRFGRSHHEDQYEDIPVVYKDYNDEKNRTHNSTEGYNQSNSTKFTEAQSEKGQRNNDGVYEQAIDRLLSLRSVIESQYPRMKDVRKRINDVKYYFDLARNLIDEFAHHRAISKETHDLMQTYNRTFQMAHGELDSISWDLAEEMDCFEEELHRKYPSSREPKNMYKKPLKQDETEFYNTYCSELIKQLSRDMRDMSQNLSTWREDHHQTVARVHMLERENEESRATYQFLKGQTQKFQRQYEDLVEYIDKTGLNDQNKLKEFRKTPTLQQKKDEEFSSSGSGADSDLDKQLDRELKKSHQLKENLLEAIESYEESLVQRRPTNYSHIRLQQPIQDPQSAQIKSPDNRTFEVDKTSKNRNLHEEKLKKASYVLEYYESAENQDGWESREPENSQPYWSSNQKKEEIRVALIKDDREVEGYEDNLIDRLNKKFNINLDNEEKNIPSKEAHNSQHSGKYRIQEQQQKSSSSKQSLDDGRTLEEPNKQEAYWNNVDKMKKEIIASLQSEGDFEPTSRKAVSSVKDMRSKNISMGIKYMAFNNKPGSI